MGTEFQLVKIDHQEYYDLGKGSWPLIFPKRVFILHSIFNTAQDLANHIEREDIFYDPDKYFNFQRLTALTNHLCEWAGDDRLIILTDDNFIDILGSLDIPDIRNKYPYFVGKEDYKTWKETGNRYQPFEDEVK